MPGRHRLILAALLAAALGAPGCGARATTAATFPVVATFFPLFDFAQRIGGPAVEVQTLVPPGVEPHDYEPTPRDVATVLRARVLVYNGAGFEPWIERLLPQVGRTTVIVAASAGLPLVSDARDSRSGVDPHVWLDPVLAQRQVDNILAGLVVADPTRRGTYTTNATRLKEELQALHGRYARTLGACRRRVFITNHAAFGYLARRYGLEMAAIAGLAPEAEPSPAAIEQIVRVARRTRARVIYFETLVSPRVAETIAREVGAGTRVLNPLEGLTDDERRQGKTYVTVMDDNLQQLADGLDCR
jgi:zinc transport system substrate-binding protein